MEIYRLFLPINSTDAEMRLIYKAVVRVRQFQFLVTSLGFLPTKPTKVYEDNVAVVTSIISNKITPRHRIIYLSFAYLHYKHTKEGFEAVQTPSRIQIAKMGTKPESGPSLLRSASIAMGPTRIKDLSPEHYAELIKPAPISCYKHYSRSCSTEKTG